MSLDEAGSADGARAESYRAAARAAVAELDEIEAVALALQARLAKLRTRARGLTALLDALQEVVPDAVTRAEPWTPALPTDGDVRDPAALPRRRRRRDIEREADPLGDLAVRLGPQPTRSPGVSPEDVLRTGLADGRHAGPAPDVFAPLPADVEAWG